MFYSDIVGQLLFEFFDRCAHDKMGRGGNFHHGFVYIGFQYLILLLKVSEFH